MIINKTIIMIVFSLVSYEKILVLNRYRVGVQHSKQSFSDKTSDRTKFVPTKQSTIRTPFKRSYLFIDRNWRPRVMIWILNRDVVVGKKEQKKKKPFNLNRSLQAPGALNNNLQPRRFATERRRSFIRYEKRSAESARFLIWITCNWFM